MTTPTPHRCRSCGAALIGHRSGTRFCGPLCRKTHHRLKRVWQAADALAARIESAKAIGRAFLATLDAQSSQSAGDDSQPTPEST